MSEILYEDAIKEDLQEAAQVLSIAITPTPNSIALWGGDSERHRCRIEKALFLLHVLNKNFRTIVARRAGKIVGVLNMLPWPHCQPTFWEGMKMSLRMVAIARSTAIRGLLLQYQSSKLDPRQPHWHLGPIGVLPEERGYGIGKQLFIQALNVFDRDGVPAYGETDQLSVEQLGEQLGFKVIGEAKILGVHNWLMWRSSPGK